MPVEVELPVVGKVAAELQKERPEIAIDSIEVIVIHHRRRLHDPGIALSCLCIPAFLGTKHGRLFLGLTHEDDPFLPLEFRQPLFRHFVLALSLSKLHHWNLVLLNETLDGLDELPADRSHQCRRRPRLLSMVSEKLNCPRYVL